MSIFQVLALDTFSDIGVFIINALYSSLAEFYKFLIQLTYGTSVNLFTENIQNMVDTLYVFAGVFMLFRITISLINMLVNPDTINDKNAGAGKMVTNIFVTILLLILFYPTGLVYEQLNRLEVAMLGSDDNPGFISNLLSDGLSEEASGTNIETDDATDQGVDFANSVLRSIYICNTEGKEDNWGPINTDIDPGDIADCETVREEGFLGNMDAVQTEVGDWIMNMDFILGLFLGIGIIIYLVIMCIDVIVRNFKLVLLQMIAPIPIINGISPNDKMRSEWFKMYIGTYLSLFLKLFAIKLATVLLSLDMTSNTDTGIFGNILVRIFYIAAVFTFAKMLPDLLSKIFGLSDMSGSYKDISNMLRTVTGTGAAVALAGATGLGRTAMNTASAYRHTDGTKGQKLKQALTAGGMGLGSTIRSVGYGAGAGAKGKVMTGARQANQSGRELNEKIKSGIPPTAVASQSFLGRMNLDYATRVDTKVKNLKDKKDMFNQFTPFKGDMEKTAEEGKFMMTLRTAIKNGEVKLSEAKVQDLRSAWIESQITGDTSILQKELDKNFTRTITEEYDTGIINNVTGETIKRTRETTIKDWDYQDNIIEGGKQAAIRSTLTKANDLLADNADIANAAGVSNVQSFNDLDNANKKVKQEATKLDEEIFRETTASTKYNVSKAAKEPVNNGKNNK